MKTTFFTFCMLLISALVFPYQKASAQQWLTAGNNLVGGEKLGSLNSQPLNIVTANTSRIYVTPIGKVGVGTTAPLCRLEAFGGGQQLLSSTGFYNVAALQDHINYRGFLMGYDTSGQIGLIMSGTPNPTRKSQTSFWGSDGTTYREMMRLSGDGNLGIGTTTPATTAILDLTSTTKGVLLPRMTTAQRNAIAAPPTGLLIYQTDGAQGFYYYSGGWQLLTTSLSGANTTLSNLTAPTALNQDLNFTSSLQTIQFPTVPTTTNNPMITMFSGGTQNKDRMVIGHSPAYGNWGLQYQDSTDKFNFLSGGTPVLTTDLGSWRVGVGTSSPGTRLDVAGTGAYNLASSEGDFRLGDTTYRLKMGVANSGGGAGDAYIASSNRLYLGTSNVFGRTQTMSINNNGRVGIGTFTPAARLQVVGDTGTTVPVIQATASYVGSSDVRGITSFSKPADGWGYGVEGTGGFIGGYFSGLSGAYTGTGFGVYGTASGTAGTRIGVYGTASGGTVNNWGGYFPTKTYTSELRVGGEKGATGYVAAINGKLIATEVRVEAIASWPDYVFGKGYKLMGLEELEAKINVEKHLPGIPAASEVKENGIMLGDMQTKTMEKVEENTLYILQLNKKIKELEKIIDELTKKIK